MKTKTIIFNLLLTVFLFSSIICLPLDIQAQGLKSIESNIDTTASEAGVKGETDLSVFIGTAVQFFLSLIGVIFVILIIYGGYLYLTAAGSEEKAAKARKLIISSVIGLIIIIISYSLAYFITTMLEKAA